MAPTLSPCDGLLARVNFPLYAVEMLTSRHVLVAGGGGSSKTGVANGFEIYEIYHNGIHFCAEEVLRYETGTNVVMNFAVQNYGQRAVLCAGQESHCQIYFVIPNISGSKEYCEKKTMRKNRKENSEVSLRKIDNKNNILSEIEAFATISNCQIVKNRRSDEKKSIIFEIKAADFVQTDFLAEEPVQRVVRISPNGLLMATGGTDGILRVWNLPKLGQYINFEAHSKEIDDIDFSPDSKRIVTISKDGLGMIWNLDKKKLDQKLDWTPPVCGSKYLYKRCRYGTIEMHQDKYMLFSISNPLGKKGKQRSFLQQWDCVTYKIRLLAAIEESLASLAVRDDGRFVAIGSMFSGSVSIYMALTLQRVLHIPNAHSMFITGLAFLPITNNEGPPISSDTEAAVLSISVDNKVCIHSLTYKRSVPSWVACITILCLLFALFTLCSYLNI